ncbi:MAG TPA: OsmC family protein [Rudaea sp.]|jgi:organic hydroperoxide reductase OsmC/OhrA|nr:OsmC family protein [Rudaea sp.]
MSEHRASVEWKRRSDEDFARGRYSRAHIWRFDGGAEVRASASPHVVRAPWSDPAGVDPEEAFVASLSSCHMLWFLSLAAEAGYVVDGYDDEAVGSMREVDGRLVVAEVILKPRASFDPAHAPDREALHSLHHAAHARCFIANSVKTDVRVEPR